MELQIRKYADTLISWLYANRLRILLVSIVTLILVALSPLPYFNLILTTQFLLFTIMVIGLIALKIPAGHVVILAMFFLFGSLIMYLSQQFNQGEMIGNYVYGLFFLASLKAIFEK